LKRLRSGLLFWSSGLAIDVRWGERHFSRGAIIAWTGWVAICYLADMGQPVKLSDGLVMEARIAGEAMQRSIAGQVEFWASLGMTMERLMTGTELDRTRARSTARSLSESLESVNKPLGRQRLAAYLESRPYPRFAADPLEANVMILEEADGSRTRGHFMDGKFIPFEEETRGDRG